MNKKALDKSLNYISSWLRFKFDREDIPGLAVAIAHKGELIFNEAYGYADLEKKTKLTTDHIFRIASHSKTFTATAIMQLQEQGKLRIDDYVCEYIGWLKEHDDERWQKVTIRQLLSHGAGVIRDGENADYWQLDRPFPDDTQLKEELLESKLIIENNLRLKYSNYGYSLLGQLIAAVSGTTYSQYVTDNIVKPLNLTATGPDLKPEIEPHLVTGYSRQEINKTRLPIAHVDTRGMAAATGFYSTAADLCAYFTAQFVGSGKLLDDESKKEMQRIQFHANTPDQDNDEDYGLGLELEQLDERKTIGHGGGFPGHITKTIADPKEEIVVVALTNCLGGPATDAAKGILNCLDYFSENVKDEAPKHDMLHLEGRYIDLWSMLDIVVTGDKVAAAFPYSWHPLVSPDELERIDEHTLKITKTGSFYSEGELVKFNIKDGNVQNINYAGMTMQSQEAWQKKIAGLKKIE